MRAVDKRINQIGKEATILHYENIIKTLSDSTNFEDICKVSSAEVALMYIRGELES